MALIKIYTESNNIHELKEHVANSIKLVAAAALNVPEVETISEGEGLYKQVRVIFKGQTF